MFWNRLESTQRLTATLFLEPLRELYKPEVRMVARELGLSTKIAERMPFPGPALSIRVLGEVTPDKIAILRKATKIVEEETKNLGTCMLLLVDGKVADVEVLRRRILSRR